MAHELINITTHPGGGFDIPFPNGKISIPDTPGGYCISSGCGSGKTESIKSLIRQKCNDGILYCVDTIAECKKMYDWVKKELTDNVNLKDSDVMMINSQANFETMKTYQEHPEHICQKKILIVVQVRFFIELINFFLLYRPRTTPQAFDGDFTNLMASGETRKYIIFDETPLFLKPFASLTKGELAPYATRTGGKWKCKSAIEIQKIYTRFIKGDRKMDYHSGGSRLSHIKNEVVLHQIPIRFSGWLKQASASCNIQYYPSDLIQPGMKSYVLLYEGAGDVLIGKGSQFKLLDLTPKYNSDVEFHPFTFNLQRRYAPDPASYQSFVSTIISTLFCCQGKTLIVVWKDYKGSTISESTSSPCVDKLEQSLVNAGVSTDRFTVTYYGASDTKSTNDYRDYKNIILAGRWWIGGAVADKLKRAFDCKTACSENYMLWYYVQLLCRIGIRNNNHGRYHVYYSSDHSTSFIDRLNVYLNQNIFIPEKIKVNTPLWEVIARQFIGRGQNYIKDLKGLVGYAPDVKDAIEKRQPYTLRISLGDISVVCPRKKRKQRSSYTSLTKFLGLLQITLEIYK